MISIELILLGVIAVIMFISIITGLCQGFRKSMFKVKKITCIFFSKVVLYIDKCSKGGVNNGKHQISKEACTR